MNKEKKEIYSMNFYCPLTVKIDDPELDEFEYVEVENGYLLGHEDTVRGALLRHQHLCDDFDITRYIADKDSTTEKLLSAIWDVETVGDTVYGCIHVKLNEPLIAEEKEDLRNGLLGQNSDGLGESVEQHPIKTADCDLYVSFWHSGNDYFLLDDDEFEIHLGEQNQGMGGYQ